MVPSPFVIDTLIDGERDTTLGRPLLLAVSDSLVVFFDYSDFRLTAVSPSGRTLWRLGRRGQGPGEWGNPTALVATASGGVLVNDGANSRLVHVDARGRVLQAERQDVPLQRLGRMPDGRMVAFGGARGRPSAALLTSDLRGSRPIPWRHWPDSVAGAASQLRVASGASGVVAVSIFTGRLMPLRSALSLDFGLEGVESRPFPMPVPVIDNLGAEVSTVREGTRSAVRDAAIVGSRLFVLPNPDSAAGRVVDIYDMPSLTYRGSVRLPVELNVLAGGRSWLAATSNDPYPVVVRLQWTDAAMQRSLATPR